MAAPSNDARKGYPIRIFIYDLSQGMASSYSQQLIGKQVDGIWHTSIIVYEKEYFYGGGIQSDTPGRTPYGTPLRKIDMGHTTKTQSDFHKYLNKCAPRFSPSKYDLFKHNCNTFADEAMQFLNGKPIPEYITGLPEEFLNSAVGQMLKPMIDNMQQTAMAQYGDFGGVGIASKPNLPKLNPKYNQIIADTTHVTNASMNVSGTEEKKDNLQGLIDRYYKAHKHRAMDLSVIPQELDMKVSNDWKNSPLYIAMIQRNESCTNVVQEQTLREINKFISSKNGNKQLSNEAFEILDELLLMSESKHLFPIVSLLKLLLCNPLVCERYSSDFMIVHQILYKCEIEFESLSEGCESESKEEMSVDDSDDSMNLMDLGLLQFTAICAVSHLFRGYGKSAKIERNFVNLAINALYIQNCNVRLAAARLLFNIVCEIKRQIVMNVKVNDSDKNDNKVLIALLKDIIASVYKWFANDKSDMTHIPSVYRLLSIFGLIVYCNDNDKIVSEELNINKRKIKDEIIDKIAKNNGKNNKEIQNLQNDIVAVLC